jgi:hypothetical protein
MTQKKQTTPAQSGIANALSQLGLVSKAAQYVPVLDDATRKLGAAVTRHLVDAKNAAADFATYLNDHNVTVKDLTGKDDAKPDLIREIELALADGLSDIARPFWGVTAPTKTSGTYEVWEGAKNAVNRAFNMIVSELTALQSNGSGNNKQPLQRAEVELLACIKAMREIISKRKPEDFPSMVVDGKSCSPVSKLDELAGQLERDVRVVFSTIRQPLDGAKFSVSLKDFI